MATQDDILTALSDLTSQLDRIKTLVTTLEANQQQPGSIDPQNAANILTAAQAADDAAKAIA